MSWRPDQQYLATTGPASPTTGTELEIYQVSGWVLGAIPTLGPIGTLVLAVLLAAIAVAVIRHSA